MKNRLMLLGALAALAAARPAAARYVPTALSERTGLAEAIVLGTIRDVEKEDFIFRVEEVLKGSPNLKSLRVRRFRDWTCAARWAPYEKGRRLTLFINRDPDAAGTWRIMGAGDEGEAPVQGGKGYLLPGMLQRFEATDQKVSEATVHGRRIRAIEVDLADLRAALKGYADIYQWSGGWASGKWHIRQISTDAQLNAYRARSPVHALLAADTVHFAHWRGISIERATTRR